jgi:hypothetical protein
MFTLVEVEARFLKSSSGSQVVVALEFIVLALLIILFK